MAFAPIGDLWHRALFIRDELERSSTKYLRNPRQFPHATFTAFPQNSEYIYGVLVPSNI